jgi:hypothetical protein
MAVKSFMAKAPGDVILFQLILGFHVYPIELATTFVGFSRHQLSSNVSSIKNDSA